MLNFWVIVTCGWCEKLLLAGGDGWAEDFDAVLFAEGVHGGEVVGVVDGVGCAFGEEFLDASWADDDEVTGVAVCGVLEDVRHVGWDVDEVAGCGVERAAVDLEEECAFEDVEGFF